MSAEQNPSTLVLRATGDGSNQEIEVDSRVIGSSVVLSDIIRLSKVTGPVDLPVSSLDLQKIVEFLNHYPNAAAPKDASFEKEYFSKMTDDELKNFAHAVDYLSIDRFTHSISDFIISEKLVHMDTQQMAKYLNVVNDFTEKEKKEMTHFPLEYFTGTKIDR